ncbi:ATP-binding protein [Yangia mangrovi]|uniref:ATP-binding protein n=1 Tax=Alloyangia mangrovi TaxID=1779329 RepID=A0ABT2KNV2_9RHOB|nr:ATP-binding protein [Alloyangia mangrovi]MCT4372529.1 ATP-binding protein [Alloyangia mangrovi]
MALRSVTGAGAPEPGCAALVLELSSSTAEVRAALGQVTEALGRGGYCAHARNCAELVLAEALNNIVEHAYAGQGPGRIRLWLQGVPGAIRLELRDRGRPMPDLALPEGRLKPLGHDGDLPEGGFGWYLIRRLAAEVSYRRVGGENVLRLVLESGPAAGDRG